MSLCQSEGRPGQRRRSQDTADKAIITQRYEVTEEVTKPSTSTQSLDRGDGSFSFFKEKKHLNQEMN